MRRSWSALTLATCLWMVLGDGGIAYSVGVYQGDHRDRARWPVFRGGVPGHWPWHLNGGEARFLAVALDNVRYVAERVGQGMLNLYAGRDPTRSMTYQPDRFPGNGPAIFVPI